MRINYNTHFKKSYKNRISQNKKLIHQVSLRIELFKANPENPILKNHKLSGTKEGLRAFSITGDIRIIYQYMSQNEVIFVDIGTHNQVY